MEDYTDLKTATDDFREACIDLNEALDYEFEAFEALKKKENEARKDNWEDLQKDIITNAKYKNIIDYEIAVEKVEHEKTKLLRKKAENRRDSLREALYSLKKQINVH